MWRTPATLRGTLDDVPGTRAGARLILALETSCDDTCAAVVTRAGEIRANVISSQGVHDRYGGVVPEIASRHHLELVNAVVDDALARAGREPRRRRARRGHPGPGAGRRAARRRGDRQGPGRRAAAAARARRPPAGPRRRQLPRARADGAAVPVPARLGRAHAAGARDRAGRATRCSGARSTTPPGEAFDKGARLLGLPYPGGPALSKLRRGGRPGGVRVPDRRARRGPRLLLRGAEDRAALRGPRPGGGGDAAARRRPRGLLRARDRRGADDPRASARWRPSRARGWRSAAAWRPTRALRERAAGLGVELKVPPRELCTDNAAMIASAARWVEPLPFPDYLGLDAYATRRAA